MPSPVTSDLPVPKSWDEFEDITADVLKLRWATPNVTRNGRSGQRQNGVDIYARAKHLGQGLAGAQCKRNAEKMKWDLVEDAVTEAESFKPPLAEFLFVTSTKRDANLQEKARLLSAERLGKGKCPVEILFWEDLCLDLTSVKRLVAKHFPNWDKLSEDDRQPEITLEWVIGETQSKVLTVEAPPANLCDLAAVLARYEAEEIDYLRRSFPEDVAAAVAYNAEVERTLADKEFAKAWLDSLAGERFKVGLACGIAVKVEGVEARDIVATLAFGDEIEVNEAGVPPERQKSVSLPQRPKLKAEERPARTLDSWFALQQRIQRRIAFPELTTAPRYLLAAAWWRRLKVSGRQVELRVDRLSPRRVRHFSGEYEDIVVCPRVVGGRFKVTWSADAANLDAPQSGELEVEVKACARERISLRRRRLVGPPIELLVVRAADGSPKEKP